MNSAQPVDAPHPADAAPHRAFAGRRRAVCALAACAALLVVAGLAGCRPTAALHESCAGSPCAPGLACEEGVCVQIEEPPPPVPPCEADEECDVNGSADGRECTDGVCGWAACVADLQCGSRICEDGECAISVPCFDDDECEDGRLCEENTCRAACLADTDCPAVGGFALAACVDGRCAQRCLNDQTCITGGICVENLCIEPECTADPDCEGLGDAFCELGRCVPFLPCAVDDDCFDPNYFCDAQSRCAEYPICRRDPECGPTSLCIQDHCRPAVACGDQPLCGEGEECVAGRCVDVPGCRAPEDCADGETCGEGTCGARAPGTAAALVVGTPHGDAASEGAAKQVVLFVSEKARLRAQAFDTDGAPVDADTTFTEVAGVGGALLTVAADARGAVVVTAITAGATQVVATSGTATLTIDVVVVPADAVSFARVLVVDGATGAPVVGATVYAGAISSATDAQGIATFAADPATDALGVRRGAEPGTAILGLAVAGDLRVVLPPPASTSTSAAGFTADVVGNGDETGPVGLGIVVPGTAAARDATLQALFGEPFAGAATLPVVGEVPVTLPAAVTFEASLALVGDQVIRDLAFDRTTGGRRTWLAYEGRYEQNDLFRLAFGADYLEHTLDLAAEAEGMDALAGSAGLLVESPLVVDGDAADGTADVDGDGDLAELVPDWFMFPVVVAQPVRLPSERVGLFVSPPPSVANARAFAVLGVEAPGLGFAPLGLAPVVGGDETSLGEQLRAVPAPASLARAGRAAVVHAIFTDPDSSSWALARGDAFSAAVDVGALLEPPTGAFLLSDVPAVGDALLVLPSAPGASLYRARVDGPGGAWDVVAAAPAIGGPSLELPAFVQGTGVSVLALDVLRIDDADPLARFFRTGDGPWRTLEDEATAAARAVGAEAL